jgi:type II secretory pathway component PulK
MKLHAPHGYARTAAQSRGGYVIFAVLIVIVVLSLVAYRFTDSMVAEQRAAQRTYDEAQVKAAAYAGLNYAAAVLADRDTFYNELEGNPFDNEAIFSQFEVTPVGGPSPDGRRPFFSIRSVALLDGGSYEQRFGVVDEGGKLNLNTLIALDPTGQLLHDALTALATARPDLNLTPDIVDSIVDWMDADDDPNPNGAESSYYLSLPNPYQAKNGPLNSLDELLLVKGMTPYLLYGGDTNRNGVLDEGEIDTTRGLSDVITVYGRELNVSMDGTTRIYLNGDDLATLYDQLKGAVGTDLATYIVASKLLNPQPIPQAMGTISSSSDGKTIAITITGAPAGNTVAGTTDQLAAVLQDKIAQTSSSGQRIKSLTSLMNTQITLPPDPMAPPNTPSVVVASPLNDPAQQGDLLAKLFDKTTVRQAIEMVPRINVNTAPREVLMSITDSNGNPILADTDADAIITNRPNQVPTDQATVSASWLISTNTISAAKYGALEKYITGTTMVYRVQSIGYFAEGGPVARVEAVIDIGVRDSTTGNGAPRFLYVRDLADIENPRGFQPSNMQQPTP